MLFRSAPAGTKVKIGRQTNAKTIPNGSNGYFDSKVLSRMHAEVWSEDGKVRPACGAWSERGVSRSASDDVLGRPAPQIFIKDVKSSNGTFINGQRLSLEAAESDIFELHTEDVVVRTPTCLPDRRQGADWRSLVRNLASTSSATTARRSCTTRSQPRCTSS